MLLLTVVDTTAAPKNPNVILLPTVRDTIAAHVMLLLTVMDTIAAPDQYQHRHQHVSIALMVPMVSIAALVILILVVPLNVMRVEIVVFHRHHHHVSIVHMALVRIAALVIQILVVPLNGLPVETVVFHHHQEKNATKSAVSLAVVVVRVVKEERVEREVRPQQARRRHNQEVPRPVFNFPSVVSTGF